MKTTLNKIKEHDPCNNGWKKLLAFLGKTKADNEDLSLLVILESNGLKDALWALKAVDGFDREKRLMACDFAEEVIYLTNDERCINAIKVSRDYANGIATMEEVMAASDAAYFAANFATSYAASAHAYYAASRAASAHAYYAASRAASHAASHAASRDAIRLNQITIFNKYIKTP